MPTAQVKLALWCEEHGLTAERIKHLTLATLIEPSHAAARGLLGLIFYQGKWQRPDDVVRDAVTDPARKVLLQEYMERRVKAPDKADDQWRLALWCEQNGLSEQALAHLHRVVQLDPRRDAAWRRLGYKKTGSRWAKPGARHRREGRARGAGPRQQVLEASAGAPAGGTGGRNRDKRPPLRSAGPDHRSPRRTHGLHGVARANEADQRAAVQILGQVDAPSRHAHLP